MRTLLANHPLVTHKLTLLRDAGTGTAEFRALAAELVALLAYEGPREVRVESVTVQTPLAPAQGVKLAAPKPLSVPILRAGIGMLDGMTRLLPMADIELLGMARNEDTLRACTYANRLPVDLTGLEEFVPDPML